MNLNTGKLLIFLKLFWFFFIDVITANVGIGFRFSYRKGD